MKNTKKNKMKWFAAVAVMLTVLFSCSVSVSAYTLTDEDMMAMSWTKVLEDPLQTPSGNLQSICATPFYIITIENATDDPNVCDVVTAFYRHDYDENGNPVQKYSEAMRVQDHEWEHGNGMAFNPNTGEIYVALYTNTIPENHGCLYVMDPNTLQFMRKIKVTDDFNILGIDYVEEKDQYVIQSNAEGDYRFQILDSNFQLVQDLGPSDISPGANSQDLCVVQDYIVNSPCGGGYLANVYSISRNVKIGSNKVNIDEPDLDPYELFEIESFTSLNDEKILMGGRVTKTDKNRHLCLYETTLPTMNPPAEEPIDTPEPAEAAADANAPAEEEVVVIGSTDTPADANESAEDVDPALEELKTDREVPANMELSESDNKAGDEGIAAKAKNAVKRFIDVYAILVLPMAGIVLIMIVIFALYIHHVRVERERRRRMAMRRRAKLRKKMLEAYEEAEADRENYN